MTIIAATRDPNWFKARRYDGLEGMIPFNYVQEKKRGWEKQPLPPPGSAPAPTRSGAMPMSVRGGGGGGGGKNDQYLRRAVKLHSMP